MSTLRVNNITDTSGGSSSLSVPGAAKAWVNFNGTGTVAIRAQMNVSSITDNGVGNYTINFATALVDTNYNVAASAGTNTSQVRPFTLSPYAYTTGALSVNTHTVNSSSPGLLIDADFANVSIFR